MNVGISIERFGKPLKNGQSFAAVSSAGSTTYNVLGWDKDSNVVPRHRI